MARIKTSIGYRIFRYTLSLWAGAAAYVIIAQAGLSSLRDSRCQHGSTLCPWRCLW